MIKRKISARPRDPLPYLFIGGSHAAEGEAFDDQAAGSDTPLLPRRLAIGPFRMRVANRLRAARCALRAVLREFPFENVAAAEKEVNWAEAPLVRIG